MTTTSLFLIRHGEIDANANRHWHGSTDSALNVIGRSQAEQMAEHVAKHHPEISAVYCSPLQRTRHTAAPLAKRLQLELQPESDLREYSIGELEGSPVDTLIRKHNFFELIHESQDYAPAGGESVNHVRRRMVDAVIRLRDLHEGESIALVSHGAAIGIALSHLLEDKVYNFQKYHMGNTGFSKLVWSSEGVRLEFFNNSEHLTA
jgi:broad specificity phosphatase PhoE